MISLCLITKEIYYPREILDVISQTPFDEILILTRCTSPFAKYELFNKAKYDIAYQDDDALVPWNQFLRFCKPDTINVGMKQGHFDAYKDRKMTMGLGWGSLFPKSKLESLKRYTDKYGEDDLFKREAERILTYLNYPQNRIVLPIVDLPSATAPDRLYRQPQHYTNIDLVEQRLKVL